MESGREEKAPKIWNRLLQYVEKGRGSPLHNCGSAYRSAPPYQRLNSLHTLGGEEDGRKTVTMASWWLQVRHT